MLNYQRIVIYKTRNPSQRAIETIYEGDAGFDLYTMGDYRLKPGEVKDVRTGMFIDPKDDIYFVIIGRSSTFKNLKILVNVAIIDKGYRGELFAVVHNISQKTVRIGDGERICQIVPHVLFPVKFERGEIGESRRGDKGFGSSGR